MNAPAAEDRRCSFDPCRCDGKPLVEIGTPNYARDRYHVDAGDRQALRLMTKWIRLRQPFVHSRWADGEFNSLVGATWTNADGLDAHAPGLGDRLRKILFDARDHGAEGMLFGGDWTGPPERRQFLVDHGLMELPWCPSQVFVNGLPFGETLNFLDAVAEWIAFERPVILVANQRVAAVADGLNAIPIEIPDRNAWDHFDQIAAEVRRVCHPGALVIYAAGMMANVLAHQFFQEVPGTTHVDVGCLFDGAVGLISRGWLEHQDDRTAAYYAQVVPWIFRGDGS